MEVGGGAWGVVLQVASLAQLLPHHWPMYSPALGSSLCRGLTKTNTQLQCYDISCVRLSYCSPIASASSLDFPASAAALRLCPFAAPAVLEGSDPVQLS